MGALTDLALLNFCGYLAYLFIYIVKHDPSISNMKIGQVLLINFIWFNVTQVTRLYKNIFAKDAIPTIKQSLSSLLLFVVFIAALIYFVSEFVLCFKLVVYTLILFCPLFIIGKIGFLLLRRSRRKKLIEYTRVVIVGAGPVGRELANIMEDRLSMGFRVVGFFDDKITKSSEDLYIIGKVNECLDYVKRHKINEIYCALPDRAINKINKLMREADKEMIRFKLVPDVKDYFKKNVNVTMLGHFPVISPRSEPLENISNMMFKRLFDVVFSFVVIVFVMSWLLPIIAILIKLESKGPVFFIQKRTGYKGIEFDCFKFRTMRVNADADTKQATANDKRITPIGKFLRATHLDETAQFFNVLLGDMSIVGPRPHMLYHTRYYSQFIPYYNLRHEAIPGMTGMAQIKGFIGEINVERELRKRIQWDVYYLKHRSISRDIIIIFSTFFQVFAKAFSVSSKK